MRTKARGESNKMQEERTEAPNEGCGPFGIHESPREVICDYAPDGVKNSDCTVGGGVRNSIRLLRTRVHFCCTPTVAEYHITEKARMWGGKYDGFVGEIPKTPALSYVYRQYSPQNMPSGKQ